MTMDLDSGARGDGRAATRRLRSIWTPLALLLALLTAPSAAAGADATWRAATPSGGLQWFSTTDRLLPADTDAVRDVYQWSSGFGGLLSLVSPSPVTGTTQGAELVDVSDDGTVAWLITRDRLTADDTDGAIDVYRVENGTPVRFSHGAANGNGPYDAVFHAASGDGEVLIWSTPEQLVPAADIDESEDLHARTASGGFWRLSGADGESHGGDVDFEAATPDASVVAFTTGDRLDDADDDTVYDVYTTTLAGLPVHRSAGLNDDGTNTAKFGALSDDGATVWFTSADKLTADDQDLRPDVFRRSGGTTTRLSSGDGNHDATFAGLSGDRATTFFHTGEALDGATDTDGSAQDVYASKAGTTTLVSRKTAGPGTVGEPATFRASSTDGTKVVFDTREQLVSGLGGDSDGGHADLYRRDTAAGQTALVSTHVDGTLDGAFDATFNALSADGTKVLFTTSEGLVGDADASADIYQHAAATTLLSGALPAAFTTFRSMNAGASRVLFETDAGLLPTDGDGTRDVYARDTATNDLWHVSKDRNPPDTAFAAGPEATTDDPTPQFTLASDPGARFECRVDDAAFAPCDTTFVTAALADGAHTVFARAIDPDGNVDATAAQRSFTVDTSTPTSTGTGTGTSTGTGVTAPGGPAGTGSGSGSATGGGSTAAPLELRVTARTPQRPLRSRRPTVVLSVACPAGTCRLTSTATVRLSKRARLKLRSAPVTARAGRPVTVRLALGRKARAGLARALKRRGARLRVDLVVTAAAADGRTARATRRIVLRR